MRADALWRSRGRPLIIAAAGAALAITIAPVGSAGQTASDSEFAIDHFKCYSVVGKSPGRRAVTLTDQFGSEQVGVGDPVSVCTPVDKNGEGIRNPVDHLTCYKIHSHTVVNRQVEVLNQFGSQTLVVRTGETLCVPSVKIELEIDRFTDAHATITLHFPNGDQEQVDLSGTATIEVHIGPAGSTTDTDSDGLDQVTAEIVQLKLKGKSAKLGTITLEESSVLASLGEIEETANTQPGRLDVPPFAPAGTAHSFFDVFFVLNSGVAGQLHSTNPTHMVATITHKPPAPGETFTSGGVVDLLDANGNPTGVFLGPLSFTLTP